MINQGLKMLKRAIDERPKGGMQTGMPKIQLRETDAVRAVAELEWAQQRIAELEQERDAIAVHVDRMRLIAKMWRDGSKSHLMAAGRMAEIVLDEYPSPTLPR